MKEKGTLRYMLPVAATALNLRLYSPHVAVN